MRIWSALSLMLGALLLGTTFAHVLEIRAKRHMDGPLWTTLQQRLYQDFATVGGAVEIGTILSTAGLAWSVRNTTVAWLALGAVACFASAFVIVWIGMVQPVNLQVARWTPAQIPGDWQRRQRRWDLGHAIRFGLHLTGFGLLVAMMIFEQPWLQA
jgi:hypothetical protein